MYFTKPMVAIVAILTAICGPTHAASFIYSGEVTEVNFDNLPGVINAPTVGEEVTFTIFIDDSDPTAGVFSTDPADPLTSLLPRISISTAGGLSASIGEISVSGSPSFSTTGYSLSTVGSGISGLGGIPTFGGNLHSASFFFDPFVFVDLSNPTVGELVAALTASLAVSGGFTAGTQDTNTFQFGSFRATFDTTDNNEVPLPGAALFFGTGLVAAAMKRRKQTT